MNGKKEEIAVECLVLVFLFFIRCWMLDVRCSTFIFHTIPYCINVSRERLLDKVVPLAELNEAALPGS
ncbi:MAG: hypothetical protein BA861_02415 [Desulfobacterales bacterium S3730MH5]|nr:MAG: hypothetical protein BA861_02415 [Desulfobacterales bacterium S3730MH5]